MKKLIRGLLVAASAFALVVGCGKKEAKNEEKKGGDEVSAYDFKDENFGYKLLEDGTYEVAKYLKHTNDEHDQTCTECMVTTGDTAVIPATANGKAVTSIGEEAFFWNNVANVTIPNSVTHIGRQAFANARHIHNLVIPSSVTKIEYGAFYKLGCHTINYVIPDNRSYVVIQQNDPAAITQTNMLGTAALAAQGAVYLRVPAASVAAYKAAWTSYVDFIEAAA